MKIFLLILIFITISFPAFAATDAWVTSDRLKRRTCPSTDCGVVGELFFREKATIYEAENGWARITKPYQASCNNGLSDFVISGNAACISSNGIVNGQFSEWVSMEFLNETRPEDPGAGATGDYEIIKDSDDYRLHKDAFAKAAKNLISSGKCSAADFKEMGGWLKSTTTYSDSPVYFTYCGGMTTSNRLYLNAATGEVFK